MTGARKTALAALATSGGWLFFALIACVWTWQLLAHLPPPERPVAGQWGLTDFRDLVYYPPRVAAAGKNPYDVEAYYAAAPAGNIFPLYSPLILLIHAPLAALPLPVAQGVMCLVNLGLSVALAWASLRCAGVPASLGRVGWLAALVLLSQPGRANYLWGQIGLWTGLAAIAGAHLAARRPRWAALGVGLAVIKPTIGLPLAWLLFCRGWRWPAVVGAGICCTLSVLGVAAIFVGSGDLPRLREILSRNQQALHDDPTVDPRHTKQRVDASTLPEYVLGAGWVNPVQAVVAVVVFGGASCVLWRRAASRSDLESAAEDPDAANLALLSVTVGAYHLAYDALVLFPALALAAARCIGRRQAWSRDGAVCLLLLVPVLSTPWTDYFVHWRRALVGSGATESWTSFVSGSAATANSLALFCAWLVLASEFLRPRSGGRCIELREGRLPLGQGSLHSGDSLGSRD